MNSQPISQDRFATANSEVQHIRPLPFGASTAAVDGRFTMQEDYQEMRNRLRRNRQEESSQNGEDDSMDSRQQQEPHTTTPQSPLQQQEDFSDRSSASSTSQFLRENYMEKRQSLRRIHQQSDHSSSRSEDPVWIQQKPALQKVEPQSKKHYEFEKPNWATGGVKLRKTVPSPRTIRKSVGIEPVTLKKSPEKAKPKTVSSQLEIPQLKAVASPLLLVSSDDDSSREDDPPREDEDEEDQNPRFWFRKEAKKDIPRTNNPTPDNYYKVIQQNARWKTNLSPTESDMVMKLKRVDLKDDRVFASKESPFLYKFLPTIEEDDDEEHSSGSGDGDDSNLMCLEQIPEEDEDNLEFDEQDSHRHQSSISTDDDTISEDTSKDSSDSEGVGDKTKPRRRQRKKHLTRVSAVDEERLYKVMKHALRKKTDQGRRRRGSKRTDKQTPGSSVLKLKAPKQFPQRDTPISEKINLKNVAQQTQGSEDIDNTKAKLRKPERVPSMDEDDETIQNLLKRESESRGQLKMPRRVPSMDDDDDDLGKIDKDVLRGEGSTEDLAGEVSRVQLKKTPERPLPTNDTDEFPKVQLKKTPKGPRVVQRECSNELSKIQLRKTTPTVKQSTDHKMESVQLRHVDTMEHSERNDDNGEAETRLQSHEMEDTSDTSSMLDSRVWLKKVPKTQIERSVPESTQGSYYKLIRQSLKKTPSNRLLLEKEDSETRIFKSLGQGADGEEELVKLKKVDLKDDNDFAADPPYLHRLLPPEEEDEEDHGDGADLVCLQEVEKEDDDTGSRGSQQARSIGPPHDAKSKETSTKPKKERKKRAIRVAAVDEDRLYKVMRHAMRKKQNPGSGRRGRRSRRRPSASSAQSDGKPKVLKMRAPQELPADAKAVMPEQVQLKKVKKPSLDDSIPSLSSVSNDGTEKEPDPPPAPIPTIKDDPPVIKPVVKKEKSKKSEPLRSPEEIRAKHELRMRRVQDRLDREKGQREREKEMEKQAKLEAKAKISRVPKSRLSEYTLEEANRQREKCWIWYSRLGCPSKSRMKELVAALPSSCDIQEQEIDLLPWMSGNLLVNVGEMGRMIRGDELTKIVKASPNRGNDGMSSSSSEDSSSSDDSD